MCSRLNFPDAEKRRHRTICRKVSVVEMCSCDAKTFGRLGQLLLEGKR